ncbi:glycosyltransferase family 4 protein [Nostoc sp. LEGE 06077]|uniref:glycosyltransferase n=1 Tax=Nostoc sp. LEGE 06077 TaxID=915325 RepID=UPI001880E5D2|nr:glycosyltransferase [Nostoc sp. LEGE 06077]MBE9209050.1 glycosyltransferase family 4 protein [Nostoc sp. LEGE 06077]
MISTSNIPSNSDSQNLTNSLCLTPALFVSASAYLTNSPGGVQICTQEYINTLKTAGFSLSVLGYEPARDLFTRIQRKLFPQPYVGRLPLNLAQDVISQAKAQNLKWIFLNQVDTAPIAKELRSQLGPECKIILLSHGLESTDIFHAVRTKSGSTNFSEVTSKDLQFLAQSLVAEGIHRQYIDYIFCLSAFEVEIERWLGAKNVTWFPRTISNNPLPWHPHPARLGFVGTIDHIPNKEGLILFLEALEKRAFGNISLRLVGGPESVAKDITQRFRFVEYLGQLSNEELEKEASTWSCFVHPLFCYSRGCSTKLAIALGWQIPVITTPAGCRGYSWNDGKLPLADTPDALAELAIKILNPEAAIDSQREIIDIVKSSPNLNDIATKIKLLLSI